MQSLINTKDVPLFSGKKKGELLPSRWLLLFGGGQGGPPPPGQGLLPVLPFLGHAPARWPGAEKSAPLPPLARGVPPVRTQAFMCGDDGGLAAHGETPQRDPPEPQELKG